MKQSLTQMFLEAEKEEADKLISPLVPARDSTTAVATEEITASLSGPTYLEGVWIVRPAEPIPEQFVDALKTWKAVREHPAWKGHPQL